MSIVGHTQQREDLEQAETSTVLLQGPSGVGKWAVATAYADKHGGAVIAMRDGPTVEQARSIVELFEQRPVGRAFTVVLIDLDVCSEQVQNTLLKTIEEMPSWGRVIMVASQPVLPTIRSRAYVIPFFGLTTDEVSDILVAEGASPAEAAGMARMAGGSVEMAQTYSGAVVKKQRVMQYIDCLIRHDNIALNEITKGWDGDATMMLWRWMNEVLADWPVIYTKAEIGQVHKLGVRQFYALLSSIQRHDSVDLAAMKVWKIK